MACNSVIIVAGGSGSRMNQKIPKQFTKIHDVPVLVYTINAFLDFDSKIKIVLVLPKDHFSTWASIQTQFLPQVPITTVAGGKTRFQSVRNGLAEITDGTVAIHDAVRPCIAPAIILQSFEAANEHGSGIVCVPLKESIRQIDGQKSKLMDRTHFKSVQTPQTFQVKLIKKAFESGEEEFFTDDASVYEYALKEQVVLVQGAYENIKITTPEDLEIAALFLKGTKRLN